MNAVGLMVAVASISLASAATVGPAPPTQDGAPPTPTNPAASAGDAPPAPAPTAAPEQPSTSGAPGSADVAEAADLDPASADEAADAGAPSEPVDDATPAPAVAPGDPAPAPPDGAPRATGGWGHVPLPDPPAAQPQAKTERGPFRGRFWLEVSLGLIGPVGGRRPAAGTVLTAVGGGAFGWRLHRHVGLYTALSSYLHDAETVTFVDEVGNEFDERAFGRITMFDLAVLRVALPATARVEPRIDVGGGIGARRRPFDSGAQAVGSIRSGVGVDFWLGPTFTLGASLVHRLTLLNDAAGHALFGTADLGVHW